MPAALLTPTPAKVAHLHATAPRDDLLTALRWAAAAMSTKTALPVLAGARLHAESGGLSVTAFDYEVSAQAAVLAPGAAGTVLVPARQFAAMLSVLPKGADVVLRSDGERLTFTAGADEEIRMALPLLPLDEWPSLPEPGGKIATLPGAQLATLARAAIAAGADDSLPVLTGVHMTNYEGTIATACTDRYRLGMAQVEGSLDTDAAVLVPARTFARVAKAFRDEPEVAIYHEPGDKGNAVMTFAASGRVLTTRLLDGEFPKYRSLLNPDAVASTLVTEREAFGVAVRQASVVLRRQPIVLNLSRTGKQTVSSKRPEIATTSDPECEARIKGVYDGDPITIAVNPDYLSGGLRAFAGEQVSVAMAGPTKPLVLSDPDDDAFSYLLMPVRLAT